MNKILIQIYQGLLKEYNPQGWWPVTEKDELKPTYKKRNFLTEKQILEICVGAILTQNTNWEPNVTNSIINLNKENLINLEKLKRIDNKKLSNLIKSSGYYNQKAERIKLFIQFLHENPIRTLQQTETSKLRGLLLKQKGIGPETADSIALYAFNKPLFVIDAYTKRIFTRLGLIEEALDYSQIQAIFHNHLDKNPQLFNELHALLVEHAKRHCTKEPSCQECPLSKSCKRVI